MSPAELAFTARQEGWSNERVAEETAKITPQEGNEGGSQEQHQSQQSQDQGQSQEQQSSEKEGSQGQQKPAELPADIQERLSRLEQLEKELPTLNEYKTKWEQNQDLIAVLPEIQDPFASEEDRIVNTIKKSTGIKDGTIAFRIASMSKEELIQNPLEAIALSRSLEDPDMANHMKYDRMLKTVIAELGVDTSIPMDEWDETLRLKVEANGFKALKHLEEKKNEFSQKQNILVSLTENRRATVEETQRRAKEWQTTIPELQLKFKELSQEFEIDGKVAKANMALSPEFVSQTVEAMKGVISTLDTSEEGKEQAAAFIRESLRLAAIPQLIKSAVEEDRKTFRAEEKERLIAELQNKGGIFREDRAEGSERVKSPAEQHFESKNTRR